MCQPVRSVYGQLQCGGIGHARAIEVGRMDTLLPGELPDLLGCAVHEHHTDVQ